MNYYREFELAKRWMIVAYKKVVCRMSFNVVEKADKTVVTEVDTAVEDYFIEEIKKNFPNDHFVSEERHPENVVKDRTWIIDPIDGTCAFIKGLPTWGMQLAFVDNGVTQFSYIYLPKLNELYSAYRGSGVTLNGKKLQGVNPDLKIEESVTEYCGRIGDKAKVMGPIYDMLDDKVKNQFAFGSATCSFVNIIMGRCDALISGCTHPWDIYAGEFMLDERGINKYKSKLGVNVYSNSTQLLNKIKSELKSHEKRIG